ncbi:DUF2125 domain-containing protein [Oceanicaulis sp. MMSF_3324]|uniref:DUF2125 domain-containing protein n=1 Tax=Oceanicaulis sp. MMSF_3324 TaxID=3046702 RepID=UPI002740071A|nr:DUF2125 domain-containing protein [Oceanicaulis sp. MMSF_3324]
MTSQSETQTSRSRLGLYLPFGALALAVVLHAIYWVVMSGQIKTAAEDWIDDKVEAGYVIDYAAMKVRGYPFRFTIHLSEAEVSAPITDGGWRISMDTTAASAQFYNLEHWIVTLGQNAVLDTRIDGERSQYALTSEKARFSLVTRNGVTSQIGAEVNELSIAALSGPAPLIGSVERFAMNGRMSDTGDFLSGFEVEGARFDDSQLDNPLQSAFGDTIDLIRLDSALTAFDTLSLAGDPLAWARAGGVLNIRQTQLSWGPAALTGSGEVTLDREIRPAGRLSVVVSDPESLISALEEARLVYDEQGAALRLAAMMAPRRDEGIALPFLMQNGGLFLGPARIGDIAALD